MPTAQCLKRCVSFLYGYKYKNRLFCVETKDKIRYPFKLMQEPSEEIEIIKDYEYKRTKI